MTDDRLAKGYQPKFDIDYQVGHQAELWVQDIIRALKTERVEVKYDARLEQTGNVFVEYQCLHDGQNWVPSGIAVTDAEFWVFVLHQSISCVIVRTHELKIAVRRLWRQPRNLVPCNRGSHPTRGVKVPLAWLLQHGTREEAAS